MFKKLLILNFKYRYLTLSFVLLLTALAATQLPKLKFDFSPEAMLDFSKEELDYKHNFDNTFYSSENALLLVLSSEHSLLQEQPLTLIKFLSSKIQNAPDVINLYSIAQIPDNKLSLSLLQKQKLTPILDSAEQITPDIIQSLEKRIDNSPIIAGNLISKDYKHALFIITITPEKIDPKPFSPVLKHFQEQLPIWLDEFNKLYPNINNSPHTIPSSYHFSFGGLPYMRALTVDTMKTEQLILWPIVGLFYFIALILLFRNFFQALFPLLSIACVIIWIAAIMVFFDESITMINNTMPLLLLVIGVTNGIYVLSRILDERKKDKSKEKALLDGTYRVALATLLTTFTTAIGFGSLAIARSHILKSFGITVSTGIMLIYVSIIFLMPLLISFLNLTPASQNNPTSTDKNNISQFNTNINHTKTPQPNNKKKLENYLEKWASFTIRYPKTIITTSLLFLIASSLIALHVPFDSKVNDVFEESHHVSITNKRIEDNLGGILPLNINITAKPGFFNKLENIENIARLHEEILKVPGVLSDISLLSILREANFEPLPPDNRPSETNIEEQKQIRQSTLNFAFNNIKKLQPEQLKAFITDDASNLHITVRLPDNGVKFAKKSINDIQKICDKYDQKTNFNIRITGTAYLTAMGLDAFIKDLFYSLVMAFIIIFFTLFIVFRSFWAGLTSVLPNILPMALTLAAMLPLGYELNTTSVLVFTISIGLAVDNSIHIISRFRQEYRFSTTVNQAIIKAMRGSGLSILKSNLLLISGLAILLFSSFEPISRVGILTITTIAAALIVSITLLPAELALIGHKLKIKE